MNLSEVQTGQKAVIVKVNGHGGFRKRLIEMGFIQGKKVKVILNAPLRDPVEYEILGYKVSLRREEAEKIDVISEEEARRSVSEGEDLSAIVPRDCSDEAKLDAIMAELEKYSMPKDFVELSHWWGMTPQTPSTMSYDAKRLLIFAPEENWWTKISENWPNVIHVPTLNGGGLSDKDNKEILALLTHRDL